MAVKKKSTATSVASGIYGGLPTVDLSGLPQNWSPQLQQQVQQYYAPVNALTPAQQAALSPAQAYALLSGGGQLSTDGAPPPPPAQAVAPDAVNLPGSWNLAQQPGGGTMVGGTSGTPTLSSTPQSSGGGGGGGGYGPGTSGGYPPLGGFSSTAYPMYASTPSFNTPGGFTPPPSGYGVPTGMTQQVAQPQVPPTMSGITPGSIPQTQQAGFTPLQSQPNFNMMMGGTTGYKNSMK